MEIGKKLRKAREAQGLSRDELVKKADITVNTLYKIETLRMPNPSFEIISKLAKALNISLDSLHL
jgi:transcriptional regulator with XRE-family HTH domain